MKKFIIIIILFLLMGVHVYASRNQNAMDFEANSTQYLSIADNEPISPGSDDWTIAMNIKYESNNVVRYLFENSGAVSNNHIFLALTTGGFITIKMADAQDDKVEETGTILLKPGKWYHVALGKRGINIYSCVDGVRNTSSGNSAIGAITVTGGLAPNIGASVGASTFDGMIDEVRIWRHAIPCESLKGFMRRQLAATTTNLSGYWRLDDNLTDLSGNGNTATNNNSAIFTTEVPFGREMFMFQNL